MSDFEAFGHMESSAWREAARATHYVQLFADVPRQAIPAMLAAVDVASGNAALDLCCGHGTVAEALLAAGCVVTGVDFSEAMLGLARARVPNATFVEADAQQLPFPDQQFDIVVSNVGIPHVPDQSLALKEARRVLRPGGRFAMTAWCGPEASPCMRTLFDAIRTHGSPDISLPPAPDFYQFANARFASEMLTHVGFTDIQTQQVACFLEISSPEQFGHVFEQATVRAASLLAAQPPACRQSIREALAAAVREQFATDHGWRVPMPAVLTSARRQANGV